jgi:hypothetical protein
MIGRLLIVSAVLVGSLAGCTGTAEPAAPPSSHASPSAAASAAAGSGDAASADAVLAHAEEGEDLGNGRPKVTNDGPMVRRRVVIAVHSAPDAELEGVRAKLDAAAAEDNIALEAISPTVLEPATLQHVMPELVVALPASATLDDARAVVNLTAGEATQKLGAEHFHVLPVLVHDLKFTIETPTPEALSAAVDREGILSDDLGSYGTTAGSRQLTFSYTGPLLDDAIVESVRAGIARQAHVATSAVAVGPRSPTGTGVDMANEPPWDPEVLEEASGHAHS